MYALTGASGQLGQLVIEDLLTKVPADQIIATTRTPEKLADFAAKGVVVRHADLSDPATLTAAFAGATRLLLISTDTIGSRVAQHQAAINAAANAGIGYIVYTSAPGADPTSPNPIVKEHGETEVALTQSGLKWVALHNNIYSDGLPGILGMLLKDDQLLSLAGDSKPIWVSRADCARVAAGVLIGDASLTGPVELTGGEALGFTELAERLSGILGHTITRQELTDDGLVAELSAKGLPAPVLGFLPGLVVWLAQGEFGTVSNLVEQVTGSKPESVDDALRTMATAPAQ